MNIIFKDKDLLLKISTFIGGFIYLLLITAPTPLWLQFFSSAFIFIILMFLVKYTNEYIKLFIIFIAVFISLRYFYWRTFNTLNLDDIFNGTMSILLYLAELYSIIILLLGSFISLRLLNRHHIDVKEEDLPTVDIYIPTYN